MKKDILFKQSSPPLKIFKPAHFIFPKALEEMEGREKAFALEIRRCYEHIQRLEEFIGETREHLPTKLLLEIGGIK